MKAYIATINGNVQPTVYTSLKETCKAIGVSYDSAVRGKKLWDKDGELISLTEVQIKKIKRGGKRS